MKLYLLCGVYKYKRLSSCCPYQWLNNVNVWSESCPFAYWYSSFSKEGILMALFFVYCVIHQGGMPDFYVLFFRSNKIKNR